MHRAAVRVLRTTYRCTARSFARNTQRGLFEHNLPTASCFATRHDPRLSSSSPKRPHRTAEHTFQPLRSSMYIRRFSVALVSTLVGYGAWYSYNSTGLDKAKAPTRTFTSGAVPAGDAGAAPTRAVLVVGADQLHTGTFVGEGPISKTTSDDGRKVLEMLTPEQATEKLRKTEQSFLVNRGQGVLRYDLVQLPSNDPIEDDHAEKIVEVPNKAAGATGSSSDWMFWGVFDGHAGWTTSAKLRQALITSVAKELNKTYQSSTDLSPPAEAIDKAIKTGFTRLDDEIVHQSVEKVLKAGSKTVAAELLAPALSGSCALLSFFDSRSKLLRVACTGDSRAVLGRRTASGKWTATALSVDQTGGNADEAARLRKLHPGEERVVHNGRVLGGLEPTRAFGDASYKWSREITNRLRESFFARSASPLLKTPPYVTAEPVVTTTKIEPEKGDFVVMASDGLWEMLTNEEVVGLVGKWMESRDVGGDGSTQYESTWSKLFGSEQSGLPVEQASDASVDGQKTPVRLQQWGISPDAPERFVVQDKNVATHLIRNALGGKNDEQVCALLTLPSPFSRRYRDDLTVQVIFFGNGEKTGEVNVNEEATAPLKQQAAKAKL